MASEKLPLSYKGHPLRRKDNLIYYGTMAEKYIIMLQILSTKKVDGLDDGHIRSAVQLQLTDPDLKSRDRVVKKSREGQPVRRHGRGRCVAGPGTEHEVTEPPALQNYRDMTIRRNFRHALFSVFWRAKLSRRACWPCHRYDRLRLYAVSRHSGHAEGGLSSAQRFQHRRRRSGDHPRRLPD